MSSLSSFVLGAALSNDASGYPGVILIILMVALMCFFMIRPQQRQHKGRQEVMNRLHPGDGVVTIGRMRGKIDSINEADRTVALDYKEIYLTFDIVTIVRVIKRAGAPVSEVLQDNKAATSSAADSSADVSTDSVASKPIPVTSASDE